MRLKDAPTVELHRHFEAGMSPIVLATLAQRNGVTQFRMAEGKPLDGVDPQDTESLQRYIDSIVAGFRDDDGMAKFLIAFRALNTVIKTEEDIEYAIFEQLKGEQADGSLHTELRGSPLSITERTRIPIDNVIKAVQAGIARAWKELEMSATPIFCFSREKGLANVNDLFKYQAPAVVASVARHHTPYYPVGIDIAGNEEMKYPPSMFQKVFAPAGEANVPITIHAGESGKPPNFDDSPPKMIREALALGARRIGHGTAAISDPDLLDELKDRMIGIESCPVSNDRMGFMPISEHPLKRLLDRGILATIGTDDPILFGVASVRDMLRKHAEVLGLNEDDQWKLAHNGIETAFVSDERRRFLRGRLADHETMRQR